MTNHTPLTADEALVLQQLHEDGEDDTCMLARSMGLPRRYVLGLLAGLKRKGLVAIDAAYGDMWVRATSKGKRLVATIWPEARPAYV